MIATIFIPGTPKNANASRQWARFASAKDRKKFRTLSAEIADQCLIPNGWKPAAFTTIAARQVSPVKRRRDPLGLAERLKGIVDGLVDAGVIPDDDEEHIEVRLMRSVKGATPGIQLTITQQEPPHTWATTPTSPAS